MVEAKLEEAKNANKSDASSSSSGAGGAEAGKVENKDKFLETVEPFLISAKVGQWNIALITQ